MPEPENPETTPEPRVKTGKIDAVRQLVQMMKDNDLTALDFIDGSTQIRLRRQGYGAAVVGGSQSFATTVAPQSIPTQPLAPLPATVNPEPVAPTAPAGVVIESPMVGSYYSSSSPDAASFVSVGSTVRADTTVCIIEAMKVFTDIPAGVAGTITEILVKNGQSVEFGQPMFRINPA